MADNSVKVVFRFRSESPGSELSDWIIGGDGKSLQLGPGKNPDRQFQFDAVLGMPTTQEQLYEEHAKQAIVQFMKGFNLTIFAYGQTASGKTFSMVGPEAVVEQLMKNAQDIPEQVQVVFGIIPRSIFTIFTSINEGVEKGAQYQLKCSYLEVYNETIQDILSTPVGTNLKIRELPGQGLQVVGAEEKFITTPEKIFECLAIGQKNRAVCATGANARSSRSHTVFIISLEQKLPDGTVKVSKLNLVDLAGSEKLSKAQTTGQQLEETKKINQSLTCLGMCIMALTAKKKQHIPYRDSKLTMILKESLGGNSKTLMMCTGSMRIENEEETVSSLRFAQRAKKIVNKATSNVKRSVAELEALVENLKKEVASLRAQLKKAGMKVAENKELAAEMEDVEEPDVEDLQVDDDIAIKYTELESKYQALQEKSEKEIETMRLELEKGAVNQAKEQECTELKQQLEEQEKEVSHVKVEFAQQKEKLEQQLQNYEQQKLQNQEDIEKYKKEIEKLKREIVELNEKIESLENSEEVMKSNLEKAQTTNQGLVNENRGLQTEIQQQDLKFQKISLEINEKDEIIETLRQQLNEKVSLFQTLMKEKDDLSLQNYQLNEKKESLEKQLETVKEKVNEITIQKETIVKEKNELVIKYQQETNKMKEENREVKEQLKETQNNLNEVKGQVQTLKEQTSSKELVEQMEARTQQLKEQYEQEKNQLKQEATQLIQQVTQLEQKVAVENQILKEIHEKEIIKLQTNYETKIVEVEKQVGEIKEKYIIVEKEKEKLVSEFKTKTEYVDKLVVQIQEKEVENKDLKEKIVEIHHTNEVKLKETIIIKEDSEKELQDLRSKYESELSKLNEERNKIRREKEDLTKRNEELEEELARLRKSTQQQELVITRKADELVSTKSEVSRLEKSNQQKLQQLKEAQTELIQLKQQIQRQAKQSNVQQEENKNMITKTVEIRSNLFGQHILRKTNNSFIQKAIEEAQRAQAMYDELNKQGGRKQEEERKNLEEELKKDIPSPVNIAKTQQLNFDISSDDDDDNAELV